MEPADLTIGAVHSLEERELDASGSLFPLLPKIYIWTLIGGALALCGCERFVRVFARIYTGDLRDATE
jgi:hypothetical protein